MELALTPYYIVIFCLFVGLIKPYNKAEKNRKRIIEYLCLTILILFFGLRGEIGDDYDIYYTYYNYYDPLTAERTLIYGPGYGFINWFFKLLHLPFQGIILFFAITTNILLMNFWKRMNTNIPFVTAIFFALGGIINEVNFMRNLLSIALFVNSIQYIDEERNATKFFALNLIGFTFHYSTILLVPFFWFGKKIMKQEIFIGLIVTSFIIGFCQIPFLNYIPQLIDVSLFPYLEHLYKYIQNYAGITLPFSISSVERAITGILVCVFYKKLTENILGRISIIAFLCYFLSCSLLSGHGVLATRLGNLFIFSYWIIWPFFIENLSNKNSKRYAYVIMFSYMLLRLLSISLLPQWEYKICL